MHQKVTTKHTRTTPRNPDSTAYRNLQECVAVGGGVDIAGLITGMTAMSYLNQYCDKEPNARLDGHHLIATFPSARPRALMAKFAQLQTNVNAYQQAAVVNQFHVVPP